MAVLSDARGGHPDTPGVAVRTFLIADVRGYTSFSDERGDEAASALARRFAEIVRGTVPEHGGDVIELRGDEALCVFESARDAAWTAVELQRRLRARTDGKPALPLPVGIGLDAGEAVPTEGGYRGRALNVAARLCSLARPGEILASEIVAHLAGRQERAHYVPRRPKRVKGVAEALRFVEVVPEVDMPPLPPPLPPAGPDRSHPRRKALFVAAVVGLLLAAALSVVALLSTGDGESGPVAVVPNSVAVIDPKTNRVVEDIRLPDQPVQIAVGEGRVWALNRDAQTISVLNARTRKLLKTFGIPATPADIAVGNDSVWVGDSVRRLVLRLDPRSGTVDETIEANPPGGDGPAADAGPLVVDGSTVWFLSGEATLSRIDADAAELTDQIDVGDSLLGYEAYLTAGEGQVWTSTFSSFDQGVLNGVNTSTGELEDQIVIPADVIGPLVVAANGVWAAGGGAGVWVFDRRTGKLLRTIPVGGGPRDIAAGAGAIWVASENGTVTRIDPSSGQAKERIRVGHTLAGVAVGEGAVWVTVN